MRFKQDGVTLWLAIVCGMIAAMVVVGGVTRLTGSGLSIVEWNPVMGAIPPLTETQWTRVFAEYRRYPQYQLVNAGMTLAQFKSIFFWEYAHRLLGRLIGLVVFGPLLYFGLKRRISARLALRLGVALVLGGLQGALGWFMVKSGLVSRPYVSHFRLAAHLLLALALLSYLYWLRLGLLPQDSSARERPGLRRAARALLALFTLQVTYGAFVAGLHAGLAYNTFPKMGDEWVPSAALLVRPVWLAFVSGVAGVQFVHRCLAWTLLLSTILFCARARWGSLELEPARRKTTALLLAAVAVQFALGVTTLLLHVPVAVASLHQLGAIVVLLALLRVNHSFGRAAPLSSARS